MADPTLLSGSGVLVTRPAHQAEEFCARLGRSGAAVLAFPTIEIAPRDPGSFEHHGYDVAIVTSANAVLHGISQLHALLEHESPPTLVAVGVATARALQAAGFTVDHVPEVAGSEGVLSLEVLNRPAPGSAVIVGGSGGRQLLPETLLSRGAKVTMLEVYQRVLPETDTGPLLNAWRDGAIDIVVVHSREALQNLDRLLGTKHSALLRDAQLVVPTSRMIKLCEALAITPNPVVARSAEDNDMFDAVLVAARKQESP